MHLLILVAVCAGLTWLFPRAFKFCLMMWLGFACGGLTFALVGLAFAAMGLGFPVIVLSTIAVVGAILGGRFFASQM